MDLSKLIDGFVNIGTWISQSLYVDLSTLVHGFVKIDIKISCPLPNKTKLKGAKDLKKSKFSMP